MTTDVINQLRQHDVVEIVPEFVDEIFPVGVHEIAQFFGTKPGTISLWAQRAKTGERTHAIPFPLPRWRVSGKPTWDMRVVLQWAYNTNRIPTNTTPPYTEMVEVIRRNANAQ